ncbi:VanZ family protein [Luteimonas sp. A277]
MLAITDVLLGVLVLAVGFFLIRRGSLLTRVLVFGSALVVSALLFLPGEQITGFVGRDGIGLMRRLAAHTPWAPAEWVHVLIFLWLGLLLWLGRADLRNWKGWALVAVLAVAAEVAQVLTPEREPRVGDVLLNLAGGMAGIVLAILLRRVSRRL